MKRVVISFAVLGILAAGYLGIAAETKRIQQDPETIHHIRYGDPPRICVTPRHEGKLVGLYGRGVKVENLYKLCPTRAQERE